MSKRLAVTTAVASALSVLACDPAPADESGAAEQPTVTVRDSAGIEIVDNHAPVHAAGEFWTIDSVPEFVVGGVDDLGEPAHDSAQLVWDVVGLARLEDGRVAVLSAKGKQLLLFEPSGKLSRIIGREGEGPGEFTRPEWLQYLPPDTLVVWDYFMTAIIHFDTAGTVLSQRRGDHARLLELGVWGEDFRFPLSDGSLVVGQNAEATDAEPPWSDCSPKRAWVRSVAPGSGEPLGPTREAMWSAEEYLVIDTAYGAHSLGCPSLIAAGGDPPSIYVARVGGNEIHQFATDGGLVRVIRRTVDPLPVAARARREMQEMTRRRYQALGESPPEGLLEEIRAIETYPPIAGLRVDAEGFLWVAEYPDSETWWATQGSVFDPDGRWLGVLAMPISAPVCPGSLAGCGFDIPVHIDRDFYVVMLPDTLGVERAVAYRIHREH